MLLSALNPRFLHVFNADSELWESTTLDSSVSLLSVEAMNVILFQDGIMAYIGTKSEFGDYLQAWKLETGEGTFRSWTSRPEPIIRGILGLQVASNVLGRPKVVFYGSPLTRAVEHFLPDFAAAETREEIPQVSDVCWSVSGLTLYELREAWSILQWYYRFD
jgi:hypothetical protein